MAYDGSGTFTVLYNWATEAASPPIAISKLDTEFAGIATGLSMCMLKTGGTVTGATTFSNTVTATSPLTMSSTIPRILWTETDAGTDEKTWEFRASGADFFLYTVTDAGSASGTPMAITRTSTTVDTITFAGTTIALTGNATVSGSLTVGGVVLTPAAGSFTMELATDSSGGSVLASGTAYWKKVAGVVTLRMPYLAATTTDTSLFLRNIPADIQPALTGTYYQCPIVPGKINGADGVIQIDIYEGLAYWLLEGITAAFTSGSATKGVGVTGSFGPVITYQVTD